MKLKRDNRRGFTLVELMVSLTVMFVILAAIATLASAMSNADSQTKDMSEQQAKIRFATVYLTEKIRNASHIVDVTSVAAEVCLWTDSDMNGAAEGDELTYIIEDVAGVGVNAGLSEIKVIEFPNETQDFTIAQIKTGAAYIACVNGGSGVSASTLISDASSVVFKIDSDAKSVGINFCVAENGETRSYEIFATKMCSADYVLDSGVIDTDGDDDL